MARAISWGDVRLVEFGRPDKTRPVDFLSAVMVAPITSAIRGNRAEVIVGVAEGLEAPAAIKLDAIQTVEKAPAGRFLGSLAHERCGEVRRSGLDAT